MRKKALPVLLALLCVCVGLRAQSFDLQTQREPLVSIYWLWRFHTGDNPAWAEPNFDDSQWQLLRSDEDWGRQGYKGYGGFAWYRFSVLSIRFAPAEVTVA
jgi:phosphoserine phosphatase RsbU/P